MTNPRKQVKITTVANTHADAMVTAIRTTGLSVSKTSWISELILSQALPGNEVKLQALRLNTGYCPDCESFIPTDDKICGICGTVILQLTALPVGELSILESALKTRHHLEGG